jgi:PAS domain S-box-containing protein
MWLYDTPTLRFLDVNDAAIAEYGFTRDEFLGMSIKDIRPESEIPALVRDVHEAAPGRTRRGVWRHRRKDGTLLFAEITTFVFAANGRPQAMVLAHNVSDRIKAEEALRQSQASLQSLVDNAPFGICQSSVTADRFQSANAAFCKMMGDYRPEELLRVKISTELYADPEERSRIVDIMRRHARVNGVETTMLRRDGSKIRVRIWGSLVADDKGVLDIFEGYVEDLTEQSELEQQVRQVQKLEAVGRLAGGVAHDFNNILVVIKLSTEMMLGHVTPDSPLSKPLLQVSNAADRAASLTRQMLAFGRQQIMQDRIINVNHVVTETSRMLRRIIGEDIALVTKLSDRLENSRLDPNQVGQVIMNLAVNARDAMPNGGTLHLETATVDLDDTYIATHPQVRPGRFVLLAVTDTGTGIDKAVLPRIFDPFFSTKEIGKGTGLGLSIVYGIVKQSGGYIWVYTEPGHGTTFKLYFPATTAVTDRVQARGEAAFSPSHQTVLLVEDDAAIRKNVSACLQQLGYVVLEAEDGEAALVICTAKSSNIDLVLTDLVMPRMGGHDLALALSKRCPEMRVLFMSGYTEDNAVRRDIVERGSAFLQKPFSVADLAAAVQQALLLQPLGTQA